ncbi:MAG TPA: BTAD domain-containing putative transcriptional regulator, partial [Chthonomonadaceae bacterium]|nr:BTAD domain-containing putative transcriptional regulator [Chthonomonadaceae bacterium]
MLSQTDKVAWSSGLRSQAVLDARCRVEMLGCLRLIRAELPEPVTRFALQKAGALLAFLALHRLPQPRERILDLFWPEMDLSAARANLSTTLASLRRQIEPPGVSRGAVLTANHSQVGLNPAAISTDVADFESLLERAAASEEPQERAAFLQQAVDLYKGDLLPEFYYDWSVREMVRLQGRATEALRRLAGDWETLGELGAALQVAQRLAALDSASEESHARLIRLLARTGHPIEARDAYHKFVAFFEEEFGAPPSRETRQALESLLARSAEQITLPVELLTEPVAVVEAPREAPAAPQIAPETAGPAVNAPPLPVILSRFFGREPELQQLARLLLPNKGIPDGPELPERPGRLVTLVGAGGNGKTRLALEFLRQAADRFEMWCGFVSLVDLTSADHLPETIAAALKIPLAPAQEVPSLDQVAAFLSGRSGPGSPSAILALDNLEHLLPQEDAPGPVKTGEVAEVVRYLLGRAPGLSILCTSRQRLGLRGERRMPVGPLP